MNKKPPGWIVFIGLCKDGTYFSGICHGRRLDDELKLINNGKGYYFSTHPERLPMTVIYKEEVLLFREAFSKYQYLREMNRKLKERLMRTKTWPCPRPTSRSGGPFRRFLMRKIDLQYGD